MCLLLWDDYFPRRALEKVASRDSTFSWFEVVVLKSHLFFLFLHILLCVWALAFFSTGDEGRGPQ